MDLSTFIISVFCLIDDRSSSFVAPFPSSWRSLGLDAQDVILSPLGDPLSARVLHPPSLDVTVHDDRVAVGWTCYGWVALRRSRCSGAGT